MMPHPDLFWLSEADMLNCLFNEETFVLAEFTDILFGNRDGAFGKLHNAHLLCNLVLLHV